jgi:hypothetical protein
MPAGQRRHQPRGDALDAHQPAENDKQRKGHKPTPVVDYLMSYGVPDFEGTCSVHLNRRKTRHAVQRHYPAFVRLRDPELDAAAQLRRWLELAGLAVHPSCEREGTAAGRARMLPPAVHSAEG